MKFTPIEPPREFEVGLDKKSRLKDCARIELQPDEQVTFLTETGAEYDVVRKSWGFYATPSLNGRLQQFGLRAVLVKNAISRYFVFLVEKGKEAEFQNYLEIERNEVVSWLDGDIELQRVEKKLREKIQ
ncbi:MAG: hypothetical protein ACE5I1_30115 [bacterium]